MAKFYPKYRIQLLGKGEGHIKETNFEIVRFPEMMLSQSNVH